MFYGSLWPTALTQWVFKADHLSDLHLIQGAGKPPYGSGGETAHLLAKTGQWAGQFILLIPENRADDGARTHEWWNHNPLP